MNPSSERLVVFVTPAQKRVLAARAARLGISLSELGRRAVLAFDDIGEEVRAAGLVERLSATQSRAAQSDVLRRLAAGAGAAAPGSSAAPPNTQAPGDGAAALPVAAAVAQALMAQARAAHRPDPDEEARVARVIANESRDLSRF